MILKAYFARHKIEPTVSLENEGVGLTGVGDFLLEELFTVPIGCDPAVTKVNNMLLAFIFRLIYLQAIEDFMAKQRERNTLIKDLEDKAAQGGVKGRLCVSIFIV